MRFLVYNLLTAIALVVVWALDVTLPIRWRSFHDSWLMMALFWAVVALARVCFFFASRRAFYRSASPSGSRADSAILALLASVAITPVFWYWGFVVAMNFYFAFGGRK